MNYLNSSIPSNHASGPNPLENLGHCMGSNPVMNYLNSSIPSNHASGPNPTPVRSGRPSNLTSDKQQFQTPVSVSSIPVISISEPNSNLQGMETPLLYCNSISSTPLPLGSSPAPLS